MSLSMTFLIMILIVILVSEGLIRLKSRLRERRLFGRLALDSMMSLYLTVVVLPSAYSMRGAEGEKATNQVFKATAAKPLATAAS